MTDRIRHRGPDAQGLWVGADCALGHQRLSIIDPVTYVEGVSLLRAAAFVVTDTRDVQLQAAVLRVRCLLLDPIRHTLTHCPGETNAEGGKADAAPRIADHLAGWLAAAAAH